MRILVVTSAALAAALCLVASASSLSKNNNGATLNAFPTLPTAGSDVTFSGCGYQPQFGFTLSVQADNRTGSYAFVVPVFSDSSGCFTTTDPFTPTSGNWYVAVSFSNGHKVASLSLEVG